MFKALLKTLLSYLVLTGFVISCSKKGGSPPVNGNGDSIIGDQYDENMEFPGGIPLFVVLIKLNKPALLSSMTEDASGQYSLDQNLKNSILEEQKEVIGKLKAISSDIKVLYRYKMVLNALAIEAPQSVADEINQLQLGFIESNEPFNDSSDPQQSEDISLASNNIISLTGADKVHKYFKEIGDNWQRPVKGQGIKVGVIDSGIDFTHRVFGGSGDPAVYQSIDPSKDTAFFPTNKVKGGRDFVGDSFSMGNRYQIPVPDNNPIDGDRKKEEQSGHGTAVASVIAGKGDGVHTQDGIAPEAELYALKVSNGRGSSTMTIIAALEYAADPNEDTSLEDRLDIVNISMEVPFGRPQGLYNEAITNLTKGGTVVIAAAGNHGPEPNIIGMPGTADSAVSVAASASFPKKEENYKPAVKFQFQGPRNPSVLLSRFREGENITTPLSEIPGLKGELFYIGLADEDLSEEQKNQLKGQVALIERGKVVFSEKIRRAYEAGAIGVVIFNNVEGEYSSPIKGEKKYPIPGVFITSDIGQIIKEELEQGEVHVDFKPVETIEKSEVIDTMAEFSSQGPRNLDSLIKPEITAPGVGIFVAKSGTGMEGVIEEGTSFASPIVSGVAALLLQYRKRNLSPHQVKSLIVNTGSLIINPEKEERYLISRQGAGRVNAYRALKTDLVFSKPTISLGHISVSDQMTLAESFYVENITDHHVVYDLSSVDSEIMKLSLSNNQISLAPGEKTKINVSIQLKTGQFANEEANGFIKISKGTQPMGFIPVLAIVSKTTRIQVDQMLVDARNLSLSAGKNVELTLSNDSPNEGSALPFNLLGRDSRNIHIRSQNVSSYGCDLQSSGYRVIQGQNRKRFLQIAVKLFNPVNNWRACTVMVEIDVDGDQRADLLLKSFHIKDIPWLREMNASTKDFEFVTLLINLRKRHMLLSQGGGVINMNQILAQSYEGFSGMQAFPYSTISVVEIPLNKFRNFRSSDVHVKVYVTFQGIQTFKRDLLSDGTSPWKKISLNPKRSGYADLPHEVELGPGDSKTIQVRKGINKREALILYFPRNFFTTGYGQDDQFVVPTQTFTR